MNYAFYGGPLDGAERDLNQHHENYMIHIPKTNLFHMYQYAGDFLFKYIGCVKKSG